MTKWNDKFVNFLKRYDFSFILISFFIFLIGISNLISATYMATGAESVLYKSQIIFFLLSLGVAFGISFISPTNFQKIAYWAYIFNILLLIAVLILGKVGMGAQRWIALGPIRFQPSEMMKISFVLGLSRFFSKWKPESPLNFYGLIIPSLMAFIPACLIIIQPDLGTGLIILLLLAILSFCKNLEWKTIFKLFFLAIIASGVMYRYGLKEYQRKRILTFLDPNTDSKGSGYNAIQSKIAIGSGQIFGKGFFKSTQASLNYLPENHTDFVFSVFNEEHGFIGSILLISLYLFLFYRFYWLSQNVSMIFESFVCIGLMSIFFIHTFINMAMVSGLLPIVGVPLPFMSYGGSSLLTFGTCIGIATSISNARKFF